MQCEGQILIKYQTVYAPPTLLIIVNPAAEKQLSLEKKVSKKEERKALRKYLRKVKKDMRRNDNTRENRPMSDNGKVLIVFGIVLLSILLICLAVGAIAKAINLSGFSGFWV